MSASRLTIVGKKGKSKVLLEDVSDDGGSSFARALGSVDFHTRDRGLQALTLFLQKSTKLSPLACLKLWKGLFYCFWHSDKAPVQVALQYFQAFLDTMKREWFGIDRLRLDKFMLLVRKFIRQMLVLLSDADWQTDVLSQYTDLLKDLLLSSVDSTAQGLSLQIIDVFLPELLDLLDVSESRIPDDAFQELLQPFLDCIVETQHPLLLNRIRFGLMGPLVEELARDTESSPLADVKAAALGKKLFTLGAQPGLRAATRELLYKLSNQLESVPQRSSTSKTLLQKPPGKRKAIEHPVEAAHPVAPGAKKPKTSVTGTSLPPAAEVPDGNPGQGPANNKARQKRTVGVASVDGIAAAPTPGSWQQQKEDKNISTKSSKKKKIQAAQDLAVDAEVVDHAAKRTLAAIGAHKRGETTVHPATPGSPKDVDFDRVFSQALEEHAGPSTSLKAPSEPLPEPREAVAKQAQGTQPSSSGKKKAAKLEHPKLSLKANSRNLKTPDVGQKATPAAQGSAKHVKINLKKNLFFKPGDVKPSPELRTPDSCRPKGSALKQTSKFPSTGPVDKPSGSSSARHGRSGGRGQKNRRRSNLGRGQPRRSSS